MRPFDLLLGTIAALCIAYLLLLLVLGLTRQARATGAFMRDVLASPFVSHSEESDREARFAALEEEVRRMVEASAADDDREQTEVIRAAIAAQEITILNHNLRKTVRQCLHTHWTVAQGLSAIHMAEAARHRYPSHLRQRVIDLSVLLGRHLQHYPLILDAPELIKLQLALRWIAPSCISCPYFTTSVANAPSVCPTARAMGQTESGVHQDDGRPPVIEGEIVDEGFGGSR